ncbi:WD40/YVTN/BNR-like repeat-containing protein [Bowmanella dokdonensis]|uniref:Photosynthesis system II assembly factor Ycf48/Hcf136-like domain-containing protein n=1 Tax=Bowmanella dokdonensis TaxID=751969 RepID=A0A939IQV0_9ALTE|nr:hypothetical protein [Bowmanella dokdonensis]MBN7825449.1 hypothetical protein [Bowmanella dokdonensis]
MVEKYLPLLSVCRMNSKWIIVILLSLASSGCGSDDIRITPPDVPPPAEPDSHFEYLGLEGTTVKHFAQTDTELVAATDQGIFVYENNENWQLTTPDDWNINAIEALYPSHFIASVQRGETETFLAESLNSGRTWQVIDSNFARSNGADSAEAVTALYFSQQTGELFATGTQVLARSDDFGRTWTVIEGEYGGFASGYDTLVYNQDTNDFWYGGQGAIENPVLKTLNNDSLASEDLSDRINEHLHSPSVVKSIHFVGDAVYVTAEGGIIKSTDDGTSWDSVISSEQSRFYFDLLVDPGTGTLYTAGWDKDFDNPQPLIVEVSEDEGATWTEVEYQGEPIQGGVWSMHRMETVSGAQIYLGLQGGGVYRFLPEQEG